MEGFAADAALFHATEGAAQVAHELDGYSGGGSSRTSNVSRAAAVSNH